MGKIVITCVLALVFGFGGAAGAVTAFHGELQGPQGPTGLTGAPGPQGERGPGRRRRQVDGKRGQAGKAGKAGKAADSVSVPTDLGPRQLRRQVHAGHHRRDDQQGQKLQLSKQNVCIVKPAPGASTSTTAASSPRLD